MEQVIPKLPIEALQQIAGYLKWDPYISYELDPMQSQKDHVGRGKLLSMMTKAEQRAWLDIHRVELMQEIGLVGGYSLINLFRGGGIQYRKIVANIAFKLDLGHTPNIPTEQLEAKIVSKIWNDLIETLTPEQRQELEAKAEQEANKFGKTIKGELTGFGALGAAQLSGFGIYMLASTLLGAINGALGLGLSFGAFAGLSSLISTVIGPPGWAAMGVFTIFKLGRPNYKKLLPVVILIAYYRNNDWVAQARAE